MRIAYLAFAKKADEDGFPQVARLFRAAAEAETVHAHRHLRAMNGVQTTADNLQVAIEGEGYEFREMYPKFIAEADPDADKLPIKVFRHSAAVEELHEGYYKEALDAVRAGSDLPERKYYICPVCGYTFNGDLPDNCPVCNVLKERFYEVV